jgi:hypothetical protein
MDFFFLHLAVLITIADAECKGKVVPLQALSGLEGG